MSPETQRPCVLIVDDAEELAQVIQHTLSHAGFEAHAVFSGQAALDWLKRRTPDVLILDLMMPDVNGFAVLRHLRANDTSGCLPVIVLTAHGKMQQQVESEAAGVSEFLTKPVDGARLVEHVRQALRQKPCGPHGQRAVGALNAHRF